MTINHKTFAPYSVLKAADVNDLLMNQTVVNVDTASDLASMPTEVDLAYVKDEFRLYMRGTGNVWAPVLRGKSGGGNVVTNGSGDFTVTHNLGVVPASVSVQGRTVGAAGGHVFAVSSATATTFTARAYYSNAANASVTISIYWRVDV